MYHYCLDIYILSDHNGLESQLSKVAPLEGFEHRFYTFTQQDKRDLSCDILIVDGQEDKLPSIMERVSESTRIVLCVELQSLPQIPESVLETCDDLWVKPFSHQFACKRLSRLLSQLKVDKDWALTETYLDTAIDSIPDLVWFKDVKGSHLKVNEAFCQAVGKVKDDIQGRGHYYIWDLEPDEYAKGEYVCLETEEEVLRKKETCLFDEIVKSKKGLRQFKTYKSPIFDENKLVIGTVGIAHDITDLENVTAELEIVLRSIPFSVLIKNNENAIINCNDPFYEYFDTDLDRVIGQDYDQWKYHTLKNIKRLNGKDNYEALFYSKGISKIVEIHEEPIFDIFSNLAGCLCILRDVTVEREVEEQRLQNLNTDFLTGLNNRRFFYEYIGKHRDDQNVTLIYLDLDRFKQVNDTYGHRAGDQALILTARIMEESFPDGFITRLGGDEYLITLLGQYSLEEVEQRSLEMQGKMHKAFNQDPHFQGLSASIGVAQTNDPLEDIDILVQKSDTALYRAKDEGRARCCIYSPSDHK